MEQLITRYISRKFTEEEYQEWRKSNQYYTLVQYSICQSGCRPFLQIKFESQFDSKVDANYFLTSYIWEQQRRNRIEQIIHWVDDNLPFEDIYILSKGKFKLNITEHKPKELKLGVCDTRDFKTPNYLEKITGFEVELDVED